DVVNPGGRPTIPFRRRAQEIGPRGACRSGERETGRGFIRRQPREPARKPEGRTAGQAVPPPQFGTNNVAIDYLPLRRPAMMSRPPLRSVKALAIEPASISGTDGTGTAAATPLRPASTQRNPAASEAARNALVIRLALMFQIPPSKRKAETTNTSPSRRYSGTPDRRVCLFFQRPHTGLKPLGRGQGQASPRGGPPTGCRTGSVH